MARRTLALLGTAVVGSVIALVAVVTGSATVALLGGSMAGISVGLLLTFAAKRVAVPGGGSVAGSAGIDLTELELKAKVKGDFEVARLLDRLEKIAPRLDRTLSKKTSDAADLGQKLRSIYDASVLTLKEAFDLHLAAREMATQAAREEVLAQRKALVAEAAQGIGSLDRGIDRLRTASATGAAGSRATELADFSRELDRQLDVARRVEQRMRSLEARARGEHLAEHETYLNEPVK
jgi:hypothetical protein